MSVTVILLLLGAGIGGYVMFRFLKSRKRPVI